MTASRKSPPDGGLPENTPVTSLGDSVFERLTEELMSGSLRPGQWVSENELAAALGVSRSPVREALRRLEAERLVTVLPRRGTVIAELDPTEAQELYEARSLVEGEIARLGVQFAAASERELQDTLQAMRSATGTSDFFKAAQQFHEVFVNLCPNGVLRDLAQVLWRRSLRLQSFVLQAPPQADLVLESFETLTTRLLAGDGTGAKLVIETLAETTVQNFLKTFFVELRADAAANAASSPLGKQLSAARRPPFPSPVDSGAS